MSGDLSPYLHVVNVEIAIVREDRYLMVLRGEGEDHAGGTLSFPGGKVDPGEPEAAVLEMTARREAREEVGLEVQDLRFVESKSFRVADGTRVVDVVFLARAAPGEPMPGDPTEVADLLWLTAEEILAHPRTPRWIAQSIRAAEGLRTAAR